MLQYNLLDSHTHCLITLLYTIMSMKITPDQRQRLAKWWVLQQLKYLFLSGTHDMVVEYHFRKPDSPDEPEIEVQKSILHQLASSKGIITIQSKADDKYVVEWGPEFEKTYWKYHELAKNIEVLSAEPVIFDDDEATIRLGSKKAHLPPFKKEHLLCQTMFEYKVGESVDASIVFEAMSGESAWDDKAKRMMKDTVIRINKRLQEVLNLPSLFKLEQGTIKRLR